MTRDDLISKMKVFIHELSESRNWDVQHTDSRGRVTRFTWSCMAIRDPQDEAMRMLMMIEKYENENKGSAS